MTQLTFAAARVAYQSSLAAYNATDFNGIGIDEDEAITNAHYDTWDALLQAPAQTSADLLEKMSMIDDRYMVDNESIPKVDWVALKRDVAALARTTSEIDSEILSSWKSWSAGAWEIAGDLPSTPQSQIDESRLSTAIASHPHAVAAKLRYALYLYGNPPWLQAAALGADVPDMASKIVLDGAITETLWSAIQSLEAMEAAA